MSPINKLAGAAFGLHFADQIALVSVPLAAALAFDAPAEVIGLLVACQSLAHLFGSLPFGILVDRLQLRNLVLAAALISFFGFFGVAASVFAGSLTSFGIAITFAGFGIVLFTLSVLSIVPLTVPSTELTRANATIEMPRTVVSFGVPLIVGIVFTELTAGWIFFAAAAGAAIAFSMCLRLPVFENPTPTREGVWQRLNEGGLFVLNNGMLRAISLCAIFWNLAFTALLVVMVPLLTDHYRVDPGVFGIALATFGLAAICGTWMARQLGGRIPPNILLIFGPAVSVVAALILYGNPAGGSRFAIYASFFLLGFGPSMWLITQNSVRQLVTPSQMLGRVNAVIQTAIYGMRPLGAIWGGVIVGATTPQTGLLVVVVGYSLSFLAAALSQLRTVKNYADLEAHTVT